MIVTLPTIAMPQSTSVPVIGGPQVTPISMSGSTLGPTPFGVPQSSCRASFGFVFDVPLAQRGNGGNGGIVGSRTVQVQLQGISTFNLGIKPKGTLVSHGHANKDVSTWVAKVSDIFYLIETTPRQQVAYTTTLF